jgi:ABC-type polar amino acid transport system ATPase subunit
MGEEIAQARERRLTQLQRQYVDFVFQNFNLIDELTATATRCCWPTIARLVSRTLSAAIVRVQTAPPHGVLKWAGVAVVSTAAP